MPAAYLSLVHRPVQYHRSTIARRSRASIYGYSCDRARWPASSRILMQSQRRCPVRLCVVTLGFSWFSYSVLSFGPNPNANPHRALSAGWDVRQLTDVDYKSMAWKNGLGTTTQLLIWPPDSSVAEVCPMRLSGKCCYRPNAVFLRDRTTLSGGSAARPWQLRTRSPSLRVRPFLFILAFLFLIVHLSCCITCNPVSQDTSGYC